MAFFLKRALLGLLETGRVWVKASSPYGVSRAGPPDYADVAAIARAVTPGSYRVPPPQVESMYRPNWQALGETPPDGPGDYWLVSFGAGFSAHSCRLGRA